MLISDWSSDLSLPIWKTSPHVRSPSMSRIAYVNGHYLPHADATVHVEDRGYQFADGVYEVVLVYDGAMVDEIPHLDRLDRSLSELQIPQPMTRPALTVGRRSCRARVVQSV